MRDLFDPHKSHFALWMGIHDADKDADDYHKPFYDSELDDSRLGLSNSGVDDSESIRRTRTRFMLGVSQVVPSSGVGGVILRSFESLFSSAKDYWKSCHILLTKGIHHLRSEGSLLSFIVLHI